MGRRLEECRQRGFPHQHSRTRFHTLESSFTDPYPHCPNRNVEVPRNLTHRKQALQFHSHLLATPLKLPHNRVTSLSHFMSHESVLPFAVSLIARPSKQTYQLVRGRLVTTRKGPPTKDWDPWQLRADFLDLSDDDGLLRFLNRTGCFDSAPWVPVSAYWQWQRLLRILLIKPVRDWSSLKKNYHPLLVEAAIRRPLLADIKIEERNQVPHAVIVAPFTLPAMIATIRLDHAQKLSFQVCARSDCRRAFHPTSRHVRKYCSPKCAHHEVVRRSRSNPKAR